MAVMWMGHVPARAGAQLPPGGRVNGHGADGFPLLLRKRVQVPSALLVEPEIDQAERGAPQVPNRLFVLCLLRLNDLHGKPRHKVDDAGPDRFPVLGRELAEVLR
jgi:hypothetical protein